MSEKQPAPDLSAFETEYDIIGELDSPDDSRIFMATRRTSDDNRRREDRPGVLITVHGTPKGDEGNALTQYAADAGTLSSLTHRRLVPVLESRWVGDDQLALVTQRVMDPTVAQRLATGEVFHSTRIAAILREVNGLLEWAREQKIVHRRVTPDQIFLEPKTDRVRVTFAVAPIKRLRQPGSHADARTIARLAVAMLGGDPDVQACDSETLLQLRPGLPQRFCEATANLLDPNDKATPEDVAAYVSLIGMADPLVEGETERDRIRAEILEEQRAEQERLKNEREEFDRTVAAERAAFEKEMADARAAFEREKAETQAAFEKAMADTQGSFDTATADERARVDKERAELQAAVMKERAELQKAMADERAGLLARREELEKALAAQRAELEKAAARDRADLERLRAELRHAGELEIEKKRLAALDEIDVEEESVLDDERLAQPMIALPMYTPMDQIVFEDDNPVLAKDEIVLPVAEREPVVVERAAPVLPESSEEVAKKEAREQGASRRRRRVLTGVAAAAVAIVAVSAVVFAGRSGAGTPPAPAARTTAVSAGAVAAATPRPAAASPAPPPGPMTFTVDSVTARAWLDSLRAEHKVDVPWAIDIARARAARAARAQQAAEREAARRAQDAAAASAGQDGTITLPGGTRATPPRDTVVRRDTVVVPDSSVVPPGNE